MFLPSQIPLEDKMLVLQNIFQRRQVALQLLTEMSDLDDFQVLINTEKDVYFSQIKESRENIKENLQTLDDNLKMFGEKQAEIEETMRFWMMMHEMNQRNDQGNKDLSSFTACGKCVSPRNTIKRLSYEIVPSRI